MKDSSTVRADLSELNIPNKELEEILRTIIEKSAKYDEFVAIGLAGSYASGKVDLYSDLDIFLIIDIAPNDFDGVIRDLLGTWWDDLVIYQRGEVEYLGYPYNIMFPSLFNCIDIFMNNKETFKPCYLTPYLRIVIDNEKWLQQMKKYSERHIRIGDVLTALAFNSYNAFVFDSWKVINAIRRNELLDALFYISRIIDYLTNLIRIDAGRLSSHPQYPRSHFERDISTDVDFSKLFPSYDKKEIVVCFNKLLGNFFSYLDRISTKLEIKRNLGIERRIKSELEAISEVTT